MYSQRKRGLMYRPMVFIFLAGILIANDNPINPEEYRSREIIAVRLENSIHVDGILTETIYSTPPYRTFIQSEPDNGRLATEDTDFWIAYDNEALYIGARLWDSQPDSIIARMGRRDAPVQSDEFQVLIDAYHDRRSGFWFVLTPAGTIQDGTASNDSQFDDTWDGIWQGKASIDSQGWTAEMRIPFSQLRFNEQGEYVWGIQLGRMIKRRNEHSLFTYIARGESGMVSRSAIMRGIRNVAPPKRREFTPYITSNYSTLPAEEDNPFYNGRETKLNLGTDLKLGIGSNITIDATFNPDFGQVEVDPSVINLSAYETFYHEKRPFFIEGADIFSFGRGGPTSRWGFNYMEPQFFYSRRIGRSPQGSIDTDGWVKTPSASTILGAIESAPMIVLNLGFRQADIGHPLQGFGFLVPHDEPEFPLLGILWADSIFPHHAPPDHRLIRVFIGGSRTPDAAERTDDELLATAMDASRDLLQLSGDPVLVDICRWPAAIPQYGLGYREMIDRLKAVIATHPNLHLIGNYFEGVSLNDCVRCATRAANEIIQRASKDVETHAPAMAAS